MTAPQQNGKPVLTDAEIREKELLKAEHADGAWTDAELAENLKALGRPKSCCPECGDYLSAGYCESCDGEGTE